MENLSIAQPPHPPIVSLSQRLTLCDSGFVFDPVTGNSSTVNPTGMAIIRQLQQNSNLKQAVTALQKNFKVQSRVAERDFIEFTNLLWNHFR
ncbi:MAG: PqqD family protein [Gammaproteobacteria bacterium]|nr:PqqD family protein [Gammaproteobacteria bacterium]